MRLIIVTARRAAHAAARVHRVAAAVRLAPIRRVVVAALLAPVVASSAAAQWVTSYRQVAAPSASDWQFRARYAAADRLVNAFPYGRATLYEQLTAHPDAPPARLEQREYTFITGRLLVNPPRLPLAVSAVEPSYRQLAPETAAMFDWARQFRRQVYDALADDRLTPAARDARVAALLRSYRSRPVLAVSTTPKSPALADSQAYARAFREQYPRYSGLLRAQEWLRLALPEVLVTMPDRAARQRATAAAVARFWQLLERSPASTPAVRPMAAAVAPELARRYPEVAVILDNVQALGGAVADILASPRVPPARRRAEILRVAERFRDDSSAVLTVARWRELALAVGARNMGGAATGLLEPVPGSTVAHAIHVAPEAPQVAAAPMQGMQNMQGMAGMPMQGMSGMQMQGMSGMQGMRGMPDTTIVPDSAASRDSAAMRDMPGMAGMQGMQGMQGMSGMSGMAGTGDTSGMAGMPGMPPARAAALGAAAAGVPPMLVLQMRMLADPVIRRRVLADTAMRRLARALLDSLPADQRWMLTQMLDGASLAPAGRDTQRPAAGRVPAARALPRRAAPAQQSKQGMQGMDMKGMDMRGMDVKGMDMGPAAKGAPARPAAKPPAAAAPKRAPAPAAKPRAKRPPKGAMDSMPGMKPGMPGMKPGMSMPGMPPSR